MSPISRSSPRASASAIRSASVRPDQLLLGPALDRLEPGRDPGLRREGGEQGLREAVDGLDPEPARALRAPWRTGAAPARTIGGSLGSPSANSSLRRSLSLQPHPGRQPRADPVRHLRGRRLGEGQAQDRLRPCARSSRRSTRPVSTCVLPVPADAESAAWTRGRPPRLLALELGKWPGAAAISACASQRAPRRHRWRRPSEQSDEPTIDKRRRRRPAARSW